MAIVIDPVRTISAGKVNLGAFRTYPKGYKPQDEGPSEYQTIPLNKIEDFGVHCKSVRYPAHSIHLRFRDGYLQPREKKDFFWQTQHIEITLKQLAFTSYLSFQYYSLEVSYFKSAMDKRLLDSLWNHYWVNTLSSSSLLTNAEYTTGQINDLAAKLETWDGGSRGGGGGKSSKQCFLDAFGQQIKSTHIFWSVWFF